MRTERLIIGASFSNGLAALDQGPSSASLSNATARLWMPGRSKLILPEAALDLLRARRDFDDSALLRRLLLGHLDALAPDDAATWSLLLGSLGETDLLREMSEVRRFESRFVRVGRPALIATSGESVQTPLPCLSKPLPVQPLHDLGQASREDAASNMPGLVSASLTAPDRVAAPDYSSVVLPALSAALLSATLGPDERIAAPRLSRSATRYAGRVGPSNGRRPVRMLAAAAAAVAILVLPLGTIDFRTRVTAATNENGRMSAPWATHSADAASPLLAIPTARSPRMFAALTRDRPLNPLVSTSADRHPAAQRTATKDPTPSAIPARAEPTPAVAARAANALILASATAPSTVGPRATTTPHHRHAAQKKKGPLTAVAGRRPDVASLVLPDVLKPH